ncbi:unnamed protein product [Fraxinus pennsylvanica]|uniref:Disease resistance N-terminal domain-containing protein n=1 Tax=Fraxinus pennsylvanica TaxID=56036 RepID=A0AAD1ZXD3_9LAMI|nr:unnamed protein product [Fraxinus pennsylvanica]
MKAFLKDSMEKRNELEYVRELVRQVSVVAYEAEDIIDTFVVNEASKRGRVKKMILVFGTKIFLILQNGEPLVEEENVVVLVDFDEEARTIIDRLTKGPEQLEVVTVITMVS